MRDERSNIGLYDNYCLLYCSHCGNNDEVNRELTKEEYDKLMRDIKNAPIMLLPFEQPDRKTGEWLHDLLQDAIDAGIITEVQAVRIMERVKE